MSKMVEGKPIGMWTNEELRAMLDHIVSIRNGNEHIAVIAEAVARLAATGLPTAPPEPEPTK